MSFQFTVQTNGLRLDAFLASQLENSRSFIQEQIKAGQVSINGAVQTKPGLRLKSGDNVEGSLSHTEPLLLSPIKGPLGGRSDIHCHQRTLVVMFWGGPLPNHGVSCLNTVPRFQT